jgi:hypothetical protein
VGEAVVPLRSPVPYFSLFLGDAASRCLPYYSSMEPTESTIARGELKIVPMILPATTLVTGLTTGETIAPRISTTARTADGAQAGKAP